MDDSDLPRIDKRWLRSSTNGNQFGKQVSRRRQFRSSTNAFVDFDGESVREVERILDRENEREEEKRDKNKTKQKFNLKFVIMLTRVLFFP